MFAEALREYNVKDDIAEFLKGGNMDKWNIRITNALGIPPLIRQVMEQEIPAQLLHEDPKSERFEEDDEGSECDDTEVEEDEEKVNEYERASPVPTASDQISDAIP